MPIKSLAVFCGSKSGKNPLFAKHAAELGELLAKHKIKLIYGGGSAGLMGVIADAAMENNGEVKGVIPKILLEWEVQHRGITELVISNEKRLFIAYVMRHLYCPVALAHWMSYLKL